MSHSFGIAIESLVAILLMLTIGYCMLLNTRLKRLKADEHSLKATIGELITATEIAERAIGGLKHHRSRRQRESRQPADRRRARCRMQLKKQLAEGDNVVRRLSKIASAARPVDRAGAGTRGSQGIGSQGRLPRRPRRFPTAEGLMASPHEIFS